MENIYRDSRTAFDNAIHHNLLSTTEGADNYAGDYMYMHSDSHYDYFKNIITRRYIHTNY